MSTHIFHPRRTRPPARVSNVQPVLSLTTTLRTCLCILSAFFCLAQMGWGSWQYSSGQEVLSGNFTCQVAVWESGGNHYGSAVLIKYDDGAATAEEPIPESVEIGITVNPGAPDEHPETVTCNIIGFQNFNLESDAHWTGNVNIVANFNLNARNLKIDKTLNYNHSRPTGMHNSRRKSGLVLS